MYYPYIALSCNVASNPEDSKWPLADPLRRLGMERCGKVGCIALFTPKGTPALSLPGGGMLLGDLYDPDGRPIKDLAGLRHSMTQSALRRHILDYYWGEYLLFQPAEEGADGITVMRDPSGGITCTYSMQGGDAFITSDLAIASDLGLYRDQIDWEFVRHCLVYPYMKISRTGLVGISELLPGCMLAFDGKTTCTTVAWSPWAFVAPNRRHRDATAAAKTIGEVTAMVVQAMAVTDQSLLLELSGGLDSSIVGSCLAAARARVACCTVVTPLPGADERRYASQIAEQLGLELLQQQLDFNEADINFPLPSQSLRPAVWALGRAIARAMDEEANLQDVRSHFSGSGGDTIFCYLTSAAPAADAFRECGIAAGCRAIIDLSKLHGCTVTKAARLTLRKLYRRPKPACKPDYSLLAQSDLGPPLELHPWFNAPIHALPGDRERIFDLAGNQMFADATLRAGQRRVRMPLLSQPVMEACLRAPSWMWISGGKNRAVARSAFAQQLPWDVLERRSKGTFMNYVSAVFDRNRETIRLFLRNGCLQSRGLLDVRSLDLLLDNQRPSRNRSFMRVFALCMIENWVRNHG